MKRFLLGLAAIAMALIAGCETPIAPTTNNLGIPPNATEGEYGFYINSNHFDNNDGNASIYPNVVEGSGAVTLSIGLFSSVNGIFGDIYLTAPIQVPKAQSFQLSDVSSLWNPSATAEVEFDSDGSVEYRSIPGGTLTITKFDTVNNLVSGIFEFQAYESYPTTDLHQTVSISYGYFNDIPITEGDYGQGSISAVLNGTPYLSDTAGVERIYTDSGFGGIDLFDDAIGPQDSYISIQRIPLRTGTYVMDSITARTDSVPILIYWNWENEQQSASTQSAGSSGQLTITMCDLIHRRISGSFQFSGVDSLGNTVTISNGQINNVQWEP